LPETSNEIKHSNSWVEEIKKTTELVREAFGIKHDNNKPRMDLLDSEFLTGLSQVLTFGANKYDAHNWRRGINYSRLIAAAYRHLGSINGGEDMDSESGLPHVYHLACCVMFLSWMMTNRKDLDDRWKNENS
jgi:hypothetical protein